MTKTGSQKAIVKTIQDSLRDREIVCTWGTSNGKTHVHHIIKENLSIGIDGKIRGQIAARHVEEYTVEILEGVEIPIQSNEVSMTRIKKLILASYGEKTGARSIDLHRKFMHLLVDLEKQGIIPCMAQDEVEIMPRKGYSVIKLLNQIRYNGKRIGVAAMLSGNFAKRRMPSNFWDHIKEVQIGRVTDAELQELIEFIAPQYAEKFTRSAIVKLSKCDSTLEINRRIKDAVSYWNKKSDSDEIGGDIIDAVKDKHLYAKHRIAA